MQQGFICVPFKIDGVHGGFSHVEGMAKFSAAGIVLEFEAKVLGLMKTGVKEVRIPKSQILDVKFRKGFFKFGSKIEIRLNNFSTLNELPYKDGRIRLDITRRDFDLARGAVANINQFFTESRAAAEFNEAHPISVNDLFEDDTKELVEKISPDTGRNNP